MKYVRMPIEKESPEQFGYEKIKNNLTETSVRDRNIRDLGIVLDDILLPYGDHLGDPRLRRLIAEQSGTGDDGARDYLAQLKKEKRYVRDVY